MAYWFSEMIRTTNETFKIGNQCIRTVWSGSQVTNQQMIRNGMLIQAFVLEISVVFDVIFIKI